MIQSRRLPQKAKRFSDVRNIKEDFTVAQQDCQSSGSRVSVLLVRPIRRLASKGKGQRRLIKIADQTAWFGI